MPKSIGLTPSEILDPHTFLINDVRVEAYGMKKLVQLLNGRNGPPLFIA